MKRKIEGYHRAKTMLPEIRELIVEAAISTDIKREALADGLLIRIEKNYPKEIPPKIDTIIKEISKARNQAKDPLDEPWHLGTLEKYPLPSDAIPYVLKVQDRQYHRRLPIRQTIWISRIYNLVKDIKMLSSISWYYTFHETISKIANTPFDTTKYDKLLLDRTHQKQLIDQFHKMQDRIDWSLRKKVHRQLTGIPMVDPIRVISFRGNEAIGIRQREPNCNYGPRDKYIERLIARGEIGKSEKLPEGDFDLHLKTIIIPIKEDEICKVQSSNEETATE